MDQKTFSIIFAVLLLFVFGGLLVGRYVASDQAGATPSPSPDISQQLFGTQQNQAVDPNKLQFNSSLNNQSSALSNPNSGLQAQNQQQQNQQVQGTQKQVKKYDKFPGIMSEEELVNKKAVIETNKGIIEFEIFPDSPIASSNFIFLAGDTYFDGLTFHRVIGGFIIQSGDPLGNSTGGPGYTINDDSVTRNYTKGIVAMAKPSDPTTGEPLPNSAGSQFFIITGEASHLKNYAIFGKVIKGMEIAEKIVKGDVIQKVSIRDLN